MYSLFQCGLLVAGDKDISSWYREVVLLMENFFTCFYLKRGQRDFPTLVISQVPSVPKTHCVKVVLVGHQVFTLQYIHQKTGTRWHSNNELGTTWVPLDSEWRTSLVVQWLRLRLPMRQVGWGGVGSVGGWIQSLVEELKSHLPPGYKIKKHKTEAML